MQSASKGACLCAARSELWVCGPGLRDAEVLSLFAAIINKLSSKMEAEVPRIFEAVFECTLQMITRNFEVRHRIPSCIAGL